MKSFAQIALVGFAGLLSWKLLSGLALPLFGLMAGLLGLIFKAAIIAAVGYFVINMIKNRRDRYAE